MSKDVNKVLVETFPFLLPRNVFTNEVVENYDYSWTLIDNAPRGWRTLMRLMCLDIYQPLVDINFLDKFRFSQVKEKYGTLRLYHFGAPAEVCKILNDYEAVSLYICQRCGKPAKYITKGWVESFCGKCAKRFEANTSRNKIRYKKLTRSQHKLLRRYKKFLKEAEVKVKIDKLKTKGKRR